MTGRTHDLAGFAALLTAAALFPPASLNWYTISASVIGNVVGSLIPDIDSAGNRLWDLLPAGNFVAKYARKVFFRHRTITHSLLGGFLLFKGLSLLLPRLFNEAYFDYSIVFLSIMIGYTTHLFADMLTKEGIPLLFPLKWYFGIPPISFFRIRTGSFVENFIVFPGIVVYMFFLVSQYREILLRIVGFG